MSKTKSFKRINWVAPAGAVRHVRFSSGLSERSHVLLSHKIAMISKKMMHALRSSVSVPSSLTRDSPPVVIRVIKINTKRVVESDKCQDKFKSDLSPAREGFHDDGEYSFASLLNLEEREISDIIARINDGLPYDSWLHFLDTTRLAEEETCRLVGLTPPTLALRKEEGRFQREESDRLIRAARVFHRVLELFGGDLDDALRWFRAPQYALGGIPPLKYAETEIGATEVERVIGRIEHGIPC